MKLNAGQKRGLLWLAAFPIIMGAIGAGIFAFDFTMNNSPRRGDAGKIAVGMIEMIAFWIIGRLVFQKTGGIVRDSAVPNWLKTVCFLVPTWILMIVGGTIGLWIAWQ